MELSPLHQKVSKIDRTRGGMRRTCLDNRCNEIHAGGYQVGWHWWKPQWEDLDVNLSRQQLLRPFPPNTNCESALGRRGNIQQAIGWLGSQRLTQGGEHPRHMPKPPSQGLVPFDGFYRCSDLKLMPRQWRVPCAVSSGRKVWRTDRRTDRQHPPRPRNLFQQRVAAE